MIVASWLLFFVMLWWVLGREAFIRKWKTIFLLSILVVVVGMLFGKYGAAAGLPWWIYYPIPMLMTVLLPPMFETVKGTALVWPTISGLIGAPRLTATSGSRRLKIAVAVLLLGLTSPAVLLVATKVTTGGMVPVTVTGT